VEVVVRGDEADKSNHYNQSPGVVSASAKPSVIWDFVSQWSFDTVTFAT